MNTPRDIAQWFAENAPIAGAGALESALEKRIAEYANQMVAAEREACLAILGSTEPNTEAELVVEQLAQIKGLPHNVSALVAQLCEATADELSDLAQQIRERPLPDTQHVLFGDRLHALALQYDMRWVPNPLGDGVELIVFWGGAGTDCGVDHDHYGGKHCRAEAAVESAYAESVRRKERRH